MSLTGKPKPRRLVRAHRPLQLLMGNLTLSLMDRRSASLRRLLPALLLLLAGFAFAGEKFQQPAPVALDHDGDKWARKTLKKLTLEQKVGQIMMLPAPAEFLNLASPEYLRLRDLLQRYHLGGFTLTVRWEGPLIYRNMPYEAAHWTNALQELSEVPLIFAADFERGLSMRLQAATTFPHAMAFGAAGNPQYAEAFGRITALESRAIGVHWNFFPWPT